MSQAEEQKKRRKKKIDKGLCCQCGKEKIFKAKRCETCYNRVVEATRKTRKERYDNGLCTNCGNLPHEDGKKRCSVCVKKHNDWYKNSNYRKENRKKDIIRRKNRRQRIIEAYGDKCACCGEAEQMFLTIDHINEDGARHREEIAKKKIIRGKSRSCTGTDFYKWLERNNCPKNNFQLLCMNCNFGKHRNGGICPHQQKGNK